MRQILSKIEDYPAFLEACWQEHLKPKAKDAPTVISLFAGRGSSLGYSMAGYRELLAVEWDDHAVETFKLNFPDIPVWHGDIAKLSVEECLRITGLQPGELDVLGFSSLPGLLDGGQAKDGRWQKPAIPRICSPAPRTQAQSVCDGECQRHGQRKDEADLCRDHAGIEIFWISCLSKAYERDVLRCPTVTRTYDLRRCERGYLGKSSAQRMCLIPASNDDWSETRCIAALVLGCKVSGVVDGVMTASQVQPAHP